MHECNLDVSIDKLSKIEGHADLDIKVRNGEVKEVNLRVMENSRFFEQAVQGQPYMSVPQMVSRICGTCSIAHLTGCIEAVEKTLDIKPSEQTLILRKLVMNSLMIRDHALHLYFFALPDYFGMDSLLELAEERKELVHKALHIKEAGNNLSKLIAGRAVHAPYEQVGGFSNEVDNEKIPEMVEELKSIRSSVLELMEIFYENDWELERDINFVALTNPDFSFLEGSIKTSTGLEIKEENYWDHLQSVVVPYSQARGFRFEGKEYMVGALSRMNLNKEQLHSDTKEDASKFLSVFPSNNIYNNNLAQAIEILHCIDRSIEFLEGNEFKKEEPAKASTESGEGVGVVEAPRGTLYYWMGIEEGDVRYTNLVIPTAQNLVMMENVIKEAVPPLISEGEEAIRKESEKIIRAFDPCMSCASHFLRVNWE